MLRLEKITRDNWRAALQLTTNANGEHTLQEEWVPSLAHALVQSRFEKNWDVSLITAGNVPVGYAMYGAWPEKDRYVILRFAIDARFQGRGVGQQALPLIIRRVRALYDCEDVYVTFNENNARAKHIYEKCGFVSTGEKVDGEAVYVLHEN